MNKKELLKAFKQLHVTFRHWGRKGFSIFSSLKVVVVIAFLAVSYHTSAEKLIIPISDDSTKVAYELNLDEIEVDAQRVPVTYSQVARIVTVLERDQIEAAPVETIQELLGYVPGIDVRKRGGEGVQADIGIRGGSFDQLLILLNGINITDPQTGHHNLNLPVSLHQIQRIEVLEGSASRVFGANAFSGAINIITKKADETNAAMSASVGSNGYKNLDVSGALKNNTFGQFVAVNHKSSDGYINNTDFKSSNVFYSLHKSILENVFSFQFGFSDKGFGANSFYTPKYPDQYEQVKTYFSSLKWKSNSPMHLTSSIYWRRHFDRFELFRNEAPSWYTTHNYHRTDAAGLNLNSWIESNLGKSAFGLEYRLEHIVSNVLGEALDTPIDIKNTDSQYLFSKSRQTYSAYFEQSLNTDYWSFAAGAMANYITDSKNGINLFPGIDISYNLFERISLYMSMSKSLRMPTFTDLYYNGPTNVGNPDLDPELSNSIEGGIKLKGQSLFGNITGYYSAGKNIIDWVRLANESQWHTKNLTSLKRSGIGANFYYKNKEKTNRNPIDRISIGYQYNHLKVDESDYVSNYALDNLKHKLELTISHKIVKNLSASWTMVYQDRNGSYTEFVDGEYGEEKPYQPFALLNGKINYSVARLKLNLSASNIFNTKYNDIGNVEQPGTWIKAGIIWTIK